MGTSLTTTAVNVFTEYDTSTQTPGDLAATLLGTDSGLTVTGATLTATASAVSTFSGVNFGDSGSGPLALGSGVLLTSGDGTPPLTNTSPSYTVILGSPGDAALTDVVTKVFPGSGTTNDASVLNISFTATPGATAISVDLMFGSEEYPEFVNNFVDIGAIFVDGVNYALFNGDPMQPLSVLSTNLASGNFLDNTTGLFKIEYDGISVPLKLTGLLGAGVTGAAGVVHTISIGVADTKDSAYDSGLFVSNLKVATGAGGITSSSGGAFPIGTAAPSYQEPGVIIIGTALDDTIYGGGGDDFISGGAGNDTIFGLAGTDSLFGDAGNDSLFGGDGNDSLFGGTGSDFLDGGTGADNMTGGLGPDTYVVDNAGDLVVETDNTLSDSSSGQRSSFDLGSAIDTVKASISYVLTNYVENLQLASGAGNLSATGNSLNNVITGNDGNNILTGAGGNDTIDGGAGIDTAVFSDAWATYKLTQGSGTVTVAAAPASTDGTDTLSHVERLKFADVNVALDLDGNAGKVAKILGAVFGAASVSNKAIVGVGLSYLDSGTSYETLCKMVVDVTGISNNGAIVDLLLTNVMGASSPTARATYLGMLDSGVSVGAVTALLADSAQNADNIKLTGLAQSGIEYIEHSLG